MCSNFKGSVGIQYTTTKTLEYVKIRINSSFAALDTNTVALCIKKATNILAGLLDHILVV